MEVINDFTFTSYLALFNLYDFSGKKYLSQKGEIISASSDEEAMVKAHIRVEELIRQEKDGTRYELAELKKAETHHRLVRLSIDA